MDLSLVSSERLLAEVERRNKLIDEFIKRDNHISFDWSVSVKGDEYNNLLGFFSGNPVDIAGIINQRGYGLQFEPINFKRATPSLVDLAQNVKVDVEFTGCNIGNTMMQDWVNSSILKPGHVKYHHNHFYPGMSINKGKS